MSQSSYMQDYKSLLGFEKQDESEGCSQILICIQNMFEKIAIKGMFDIYQVSSDMASNFNQAYSLVRQRMERHEQ